MIRTVKRAFTLAEAMITITIVSLVMAATMPIIIKSQNAPSEAPWKYVTLGDLSQNAAVYTVLGGSAVSVFGDKRVPIDTNVTTNKSQVFASKMNPKLSIVARNHSYNPLISRHLIDFYEKHATDADTYYNIGKISFDNYYNLAMGKNALDNIQSTSSVTLSNFSDANLWTSLSSSSAALNTAVGQYAMGGDTKYLAYSTETPTRNMSGSGNTALGAFALRRNTNGSYNTAVGWSALESATNTTPGQGTWNVAVGGRALRVNNTGVHNVAMGGMITNTSGSYNTAIGTDALYSNTTGSNNIAIGKNAGRSNTTDSYKLFISANQNYQSSNALIYGDDGGNGGNGTRKILFNVSLNAGGYYDAYFGSISDYEHHIVNYSEMVSYVTGIVDIYHSAHNSDFLNGNLLAYSDSRLKNILSDNTAGLKEILQLNVKNYTMKKDKNKEIMVGVIAQDLQKVFPNSVFEGRDGYLRIKRDEIFYACINAIKELHAMIQDVIAKIAGLDEKIRILEDRNKINEEKIIALEKQNKLFEERLSALENDKVKAKAEKKQKLLEQTEKVEKSEKTEKITNPITEETK